ncbi:MAG: hypothetical protein M0P49_01065 [Bacilli bacterium]|nr:hypothetical protein [Bacilli bacterium]
MNNIIDFNKIREIKNIDNLTREIGESLGEYISSKLRLILNTVLFENIEEDPMEKIFGELQSECVEKILSDCKFMSSIGTLDFIHELDIKLEDIIKNKMKEM